MANAVGPDRIVRCHHCGAAVHIQDAQAITVDSDGEMRVWTPARVGYSRRYGHVPRLRYLCMDCDSDLFGSTAQEEAERDERADHAGHAGE